MKATIKVEKEVELETLHVEAGVRYWQDTEVNGEPDTEDGDNIPCKEGELWKPVIELNTGRIKNWEIGKTADVHYKVCDDGSYCIKDQEGNVVLKIERDYVPKMLCPEESGYGDYIIMHIDENGMIRGWRASLQNFVDHEDL